MRFTPSAGISCRVRAPIRQKGPLPWTSLMDFEGKISLMIVKSENPRHRKNPNETLPSFWMETSDKISNKDVSPTTTVADWCAHETVKYVRNLSPQSPSALEVGRIAKMCTLTERFTQNPLCVETRRLEGPVDFHNFKSSTFATPKLCGKIKHHLNI